MGYKDILIGEGSSITRKLFPDKLVDYRNCFGCSIKFYLYPNMKLIKGGSNHFMDTNIIFFHNNEGMRILLNGVLLYSFNPFLIKIYDMDMGISFLNEICKRMNLKNLENYYYDRHVIIDI